ncbi:restriction endonuclease subunit S [Zafaria sp. Z1313]|uniref:restriction endonuclease subunit S n=1 Tax=unclassified Zafaria TaxID=2828765 RepID=UPI002E7A69EC|nr:restriction endonuclease subunit S [Zafaria sp. J156]MEE1620424.1 restriction endonuclease subunit S [Zafaria sp. J156]
MTVVPGGWTTRRLLDLVAIRSGQVDPKQPQYRDMPLIAPDHIEVGTGRLLAVRSAHEQGAISGKYVVDPGDVIYSKIRPYLMKAHRAQFPALCSADMYPLKPRDGVDGRYVVNVLLDRRFTNFAVGESMRSGIPKVNREALAGYELPVPAHSEQRAIGEVLSDADGLIMALEKLIAKKRDVKQGMTQELLTGRTRLPGFTGDWDPVRLRDVGSTYGGLIGKGKADFGTGSALFVTFVEVISGPRLRGTHLERVRVRKGERQNRIERGDIIFNGSSETPDEVALAAAVDFETSGDVFLNSFCFGFRLNHRQRIDPMYLAHYFRSSEGRAAVSALAQGATRYNIAKSKLVDLAPELPPLAEQHAIADVLQHADAEIEALERRLESARAVKVGMMQELLTGRTRLPVTEEA